MRAIVADDHPLYLEAARTHLERQFPGIAIVEATSLPEVLERLAGCGPVDLVLLDWSMPGMDGDAGVRAAVAHAAGAPVAVMSGVARREEASACIAAGARGFIPKTLDSAVFAAALTMIAVGGTYVPAELVAPVGVPSQTDGRELSRRELEVLAMIADGCSNKEIARDLAIQEVTVKLHLTHIFGKLGVKNRAQAAVKALETRLVRR